METIQVPVDPERKIRDERIFPVGEVVTIEDADAANSGGWRVLSIIEDEEGRPGWRHYWVGIRRPSRESNDNGGMATKETLKVSQANLVRSNPFGEISSPEKAKTRKELETYLTKLAGAYDRGYMQGSVDTNGKMHKYLAVDILNEARKIWNANLSEKELHERLVRVTSAAGVRDKVRELYNEKEVLSSPAGVINVEDSYI